MVVVGCSRGGGRGGKGLWKQRGLRVKGAQREELREWEGALKARITESGEGTAPRIEDSPGRACSSPGELPGGLACFPLGESFPPPSQPEGVDPRAHQLMTKGLTS